MAQVTVTLDVPNETIDDILTTAFEGGSNYWMARKVGVPHWPEGAEFASDVVSRGGTVVIYEDLEEDGIKEHVLTFAKMLQGIVDWLANYDVAGEIDAHAADYILQRALFGDVVYG